jgi:cyanophycinase-like exopeptidase
VALEAANRRGAAVAGASGGLGVLNDHIVFPDVTAEPAPNALGLAAPVRAMAHFDRMEIRRPEMLQRVLGSMKPGQIAVGVDEDTAVVWTEGEWRAMGHKRVVVFKDGEREIYGNGDTVPSIPPPLRAIPNEQ